MKSTTAVDRCEGFTHGDLVLRSVDGDEFHVHSAVLSVASPVFEDMFTACSPQSGQLIMMAETSEMLRIMLGFIYPKRSPVICSFETLEKAFHVADKYQLDDMHHQLRQRLSLADSPVSVFRDPLGALRIASSLGFQDEVNLAISVSQNQYQLNTIDCLLEVAERTPDSIPWIKLLAIPLIRNGIISDVLLNFYEAPMRLAGSSFTRALCESCSESHHYGAHNSPPEWQARWARGVTEELKKKPANEWERYFGTEYLLEAVSQYDMPIRTPRGDCTCVEKVKFYEYEFLGWSSHVLRSLQSRLECLKKLEALR
ncbi:Broad-Complex, Tramtrack and Bric a brac, partial [Rhizoctonia solani]